MTYEHARQVCIRYISQTADRRTRCDRIERARRCMARVKFRFARRQLPR